MSLWFVLSATAGAVRPSSSDIDQIDAAIASLERASRTLQPETPQLHAGLPSEVRRLRRALRRTTVPVLPRMDLERDGESDDPTSPEDLDRIDENGMPNKEKAMLVRKVVGVVQDEVLKHKGISADCKAVTKQKIDHLKSLARDITGEVADKAYEAHRKEEKEEFDKERKLASTLLGWRMDLGQAYENYRESQYGKPHEFLKKRSEVAQQANDELPAAFDDLYQWTTTHPELRDVVGHNLHEDLPKRLNLNDMTGMATADDIVA